LLPPPPLAALGAGQPSSLRPAKVRPSGSRPPFARPHLASVSYPAFDDRKCFPGLSSHHPSVWGSDDERSSTPPPSNSPHPGYPGRHDLPVQRETVRGLFYFILSLPSKKPLLSVWDLETYRFFICGLPWSVEGYLVSILPAAAAQPPVRFNPTLIP
jgi:hypothetical protein